jgi:hypothetical protein
MKTHLTAQYLLLLFFFSPFIFITLDVLDIAGFRGQGFIYVLLKIV